ncbi:PRC and DUF2382 domain-containing protein [Herbiconiux daphne]|uniref:PRC and DUF2382 domain-containing protein n=1 Tax=Herbiconiux daphne TaxID=2970914 RepID=A0ABT2GWV3_9MICO|nr:PRC and DUF2382 domain-containing protein [Herbiconiux daphne]MCS5732439.1 PRC and DUF2382 domain-containing protein [Herbiconiux daphne]
MLPSANIQSIVGATLYGTDEEKIGRISQVFVDATDGHPTWAEVHVGALGRHTTYVPLHEATWEHDDVYVPYDKDLVKNAPRPDGDKGLDTEQEQELTRHYSGEPPTATDAPPAVTDDLETDRDREVDHGTAPDRAAPTQELDDDRVLWEERLVVSKEKVPVAKVHLETTTVTEQHQVTADVQKERVAVDQRDTLPPTQD